MRLWTRLEHWERISASPVTLTMKVTSWAATLAMTETNTVSFCVRVLWLPLTFHSSAPSELNSTESTTQESLPVYGSMKPLLRMGSFTRKATLHIWTIPEHSIPFLTESTPAGTSSEIGTRINPPSVTGSCFQMVKYSPSMYQTRFQMAQPLMG